MDERTEESNVLIQTLDENKSKLSAYDYSKARLARTLLRCIGHPSTSHFIRIVQNQGIPNSPITVQDIRNAEFIWGPDLGSLKCKTVRRQPAAVRIQNIAIPLQITQQYKHVTISVLL